MQHETQARDALANLLQDERAPSDLTVLRTRLDAFVKYHSAEGRPIVLITSGGTMVPLERRTVRFVDNFSTGQRGASLAERMAKQGYAVIYLHRRGCKRPFYSTAVEGLETLLSPAAWESTDHRKTDSGDTPASVQLGTLQLVRGVTDALRYAVPWGPDPSSALCLEVPYSSVSDYLFTLRSASQALSSAGPAGLLLLAAAVSDFYVPDRDMAEHKIQSGFGESNGLTLRLQPVPKALGHIKREWCPHATVVSFKLETEPDLLLPKAVAAIQRYGVDGVVANLLDRRYSEVALVRPVGSEVSNEAAAARASGNSYDALIAHVPSDNLKLDCGALGLSSDVVSAHTLQKRISVSPDSLPTVPGAPNPLRRLLQHDAPGSQQQTQAHVTVIKAPPMPVAASIAGASGKEATHLHNGVPYQQSPWLTPPSPGAIAAAAAGTDITSVISATISGARWLMGAPPSGPSLGGAIGAAAGLGASESKHGPEALEDMLACALVALHREKLCEAGRMGKGGSSSAS